MTVNYQEAGSRFHLFTAKTHVDALINSLPILFVALIFSSGQN